jgi:hypothetical protein
LVIVDVHLQLPEVLVRQLPDLEVQQDERASDPVVKHQVDEEMPAFERDPLLAAHEGEALAQFEQKLLEFGDQGLLQFGFVEPPLVSEAGELQHEWVFHQVGGLAHLMPFLSQGEHARLVSAQGQTLEEQRVDLPIQLAS